MSSKLIWKDSDACLAPNFSKNWFPRLCWSCIPLPTSKIGSLRFYRIVPSCYNHSHSWGDFAAFWHFTEFLQFSNFWSLFLFIFFSTTNWRIVSNLLIINTSSSNHIHTFALLFVLTWAFEDMDNTTITFHLGISREISTPRKNKSLFLCPALVWLPERMLNRWNSLCHPIRIDVFVQPNSVPKCTPRSSRYL